MGSPGSPDSLNFHVGLAKLKPALGGGWASFGDIIMYKKSLALSLQGGVASSSVAWDVPGPDGTMPAFGDPRPWLHHSGGLSLLPSQPAGRGMPGHCRTKGWWPTPAAWPGSCPGLPSPH